MISAADRTSRNRYGWVFLLNCCNWPTVSYVTTDQQWVLSACGQATTCSSRPVAHRCLVTEPYCRVKPSPPLPAAAWRSGTTCWAQGSAHCPFPWWCCPATSQWRCGHCRATSRISGASPGCPSTASGSSTSCSSRAQWAAVTWETWPSMTWSSPPAPAHVSHCCLSVQGIDAVVVTQSGHQWRWARCSGLKRVPPSYPVV